MDKCTDGWREACIAEADSKIITTSMVESPYNINK